MVRLVLLRLGLEVVGFLAELVDLGDEFLIPLKDGSVRCHASDVQSSQEGGG